MKKAFISSIEYYLPENVLTNAQLSSEFPEWTMEKIEEKTGILKRCIAASDECSSDLGVLASRKLFASRIIEPDEIDYILFCTQSPDYFLPTSACIMQERLKISKKTGAIDFNLGCSGFIFGLGLAKGLVETEQAKNVLFVTAETYTKFIHPKDKSVRTLFGDAASATLIQGKEMSDDIIGPFVYGTDGSGAENLIVKKGGQRFPDTSEHEKVKSDKDSNLRTENNLYMNGSEIFTFTILSVPKTVKELISKAGKKFEDIDLFVFHQANKLILEHLKNKIKIPDEKFYVSLKNYGNTVSSTIPIALKNAMNEGILKPGNLVMLVGFGVGYSVGATLVNWQ